MNVMEVIRNDIENKRDPLRNVELISYMCKNFFEINWTEVPSIFRKVIEDFLSTENKHIRRDNSGCFYITTEFGNIHTYNNGEFMFFPTNGISLSVSSSTDSFASLVTEDMNLVVFQNGRINGTLVKQNIIHSAICGNFGLYLTKDHVLFPFVVGKSEEIKCSGEDMSTYTLARGGIMGYIRNDFSARTWDFKTSSFGFAPEDKFLYISSYQDALFGITTDGQIVSWDFTQELRRFSDHKYCRVYYEDTYLVAIDVEDNIYFCLYGKTTKIGSGATCISTCPDYFACVIDEKVHFYDYEGEEFFIFKESPVEEIACSKDLTMCLLTNCYVIVLNRNKSSDVEQSLPAFEGGLLKRADKDVDDYLRILDKCLIVEGQNKHELYYSQLEEFLQTKPDNFVLSSKGILSPFVSILKNFGYKTIRPISPRMLRVSFEESVVQSNEQNKQLDSVKEESGEETKDE